VLTPTDSGRAKERMDSANAAVAALPDLFRQIRLLPRRWSTGVPPPLSPTVCLAPQPIDVTVMARISPR
jgi:hypothetical protein